MKKVVLLVLPVLFLLIGFDYGMAEVAKVSPELAAARAKYDTPFIKKYRPRYETNDKLGIYRAYAVNECREKCSKNDKEMIKKLAEHGDMFALFISPAILVDRSDTNYIKKYLELALISANKGETHHMITMASEYKRKNIPMAIKYATLAKENGLIGGYSYLRGFYELNDDVKNFCAISQEAYAKYGIESLTSIIIDPNSTTNKFFFNHCSKQKSEEIITKLGAEGVLINGYTLVHQKNYAVAYKEFLKIYKEGDSSKISANAGYCLGMMNYYGKGIDKNIEKGLKLLKETFDNGVLYWDAPEQEKFALPAKLELISYYGGNCYSIQEKTR